MKKIVFAALAASLVTAPAFAAHHEEKKAPLSFKDMDTDGSKTVSAEEWAAGHRNPKNFAGVDTDGDGQVTRAEFKAQQERWKAKQAEKNSMEGHAH